MSQNIKMTMFDAEILFQNINWKINDEPSMETISSNHYTLSDIDIFNKLNEPLSEKIVIKMPAWRYGYDTITIITKLIDITKPLDILDTIYKYYKVSANWDMYKDENISDYAKNNNVYLRADLMGELIYFKGLKKVRSNEYGYGQIYYIDLADK